MEKLHLYNGFDIVWIFNGANGQFPSGVFAELEQAESWIYKNELTGTLTAYPVGIGIYDWAVNKNLFQPRNDKQRSSGFIQRFSSASQVHYHYENGASKTHPAS